MEGRLVSLDINNKRGIVDTRNDNYGRLTIYFSIIPANLVIDATVEFEIKVSAAGNTYAKFISMVERNQAIFNTEDRDQWYEWGEDEEDDFINHIVPRIGVNLIINPAKATSPWEIDLYDNTNQKYADLKTQNTPFFTAGRYNYNGSPYNPQFAVTFNKKDYENYRDSHPDCDIYFWINWTQLQYRNITLQPLYGVWRASFQRMREKIENNEVVLHAYMHRTNDDHNAKDSYIFDLSDTTVFERLL